MKKLSYTVVLGLLAVFASIGTIRADEALRRIQQSLHDQGFYYGTIDGAPGDETTHAIRRYQIRNGLAVTGQLNDETAKSIERTGSTVAKSSGNGGSNDGGKVTGNNPRAGNAATSIDEDRRYAQGSNAPAPGRAMPAPTPAYRPPPAPRPDASDDNDGQADNAPAPRAPVNRPDLRAAPPSEDAAPAPRTGVPPSAALMSVFERTPYEFAPPPVQADVLRRAQAILLRDGFYDGEANGRPNPVTFEALTNFQGVNHLRRTGRLDEPTLAAMRLLPVSRPPGFQRHTYGDERRGPDGVYQGRVTQ